MECLAAVAVAGCQQEQYAKTTGNLIALICTNAKQPEHSTLHVDFIHAKQQHSTSLFPQIVSAIPTLAAFPTRWQVQAASDLTQVMTNIQCSMCHRQNWQGLPSS